MKVKLIQPEYSFDPNDLDSCFNKMISLMRECNDNVDIIVMPEWCEVSAALEGKDGYFYAINKYNQIFMDEAIAMAKRCHAITFVNCGYKYKDTYRNTTHAIDRDGNVVGRYFKAHIAPSEAVAGIDDSYSHSYNRPYTVTIEGIKFGFLTCYDFYMYEMFPAIAREKVDIIIGCSHQRTDTHETLSIINRFLCYNTNAYLLRASVSLGKDSKICGCSCVISPKGEELLNMKSDIGIGQCEIDVNNKYYKPAGFGGKSKSHHEYIDQGRRPWLYRNSGSSVVLPDNMMPYPRLCAHRGFNTIAPENTLPAFGAAIALGAQEIEFDIWSTKDGVLVSCHDDTLDRVSNGTGKIYDYTYEELLKLDFGYKFSDKYKGLKIVTFEEILQKFAARVIMNIHVKIWDINKSDDKLDEIVSLIKKYDCEKYCYFMSSNDSMLIKAKEKYPEIGICVGAGVDPLLIVDRAIKIGAKKVQIAYWGYDKEMIKKAHEHGIRCNYFFSDTPKEAKELLDAGIDCLLTNDYLNIKNSLIDEGFEL